MADRARELIQRHGIECAAKETVSQNHMNKIAEFIDWEEVGRYLPGITKVAMRDIQDNNTTQARRRKALLDLWEQENENATYEMMIIAMCEARKIKDATTVCKMLVPAGQVPGRPLGPRGNGLAGSPGLAVLVTCDYETNDSLKTLKGTRFDAEEMKKTFDHLNYYVYSLENPTKERMMTFLDDISERELSNYEGETDRKVIMFAFSGHGGSEAKVEKVYANDGEEVYVEDEIVLSFVKNKKVFRIPKLFFIDACRGPDLLTKGAGKMVAKSAEQFVPKGYVHVEGNYCINYSTIPGHIAYAEEGGSIWMPRIARALRGPPKSFQNIVDNVKKEVHDELEKRGQEKQLCDSYSRLICGELHLQQ